MARCMTRDRFHAAVRLAPTTAGRGAPAKSGRRQRRRAAESDRQLDARVDGPRQILLLGLPVHIARDCPPRDGQHRKHPRLRPARPNTWPIPTVAIQRSPSTLSTSSDGSSRIAPCDRPKPPNHERRADRRGRAGAGLQLLRMQRQSIKFVYSTGATTRRGSDFNTLNVTWQLVTF